jgi:glycosyltransferase involved in cell wall biosynthesis
MELSRMNILVVCQYYFPEPFRISDICESLVQKGHNVTVLTGLPNYPEGRVLNDYRNFQKRKENINGVNIIRTFEIGRGTSHIRLFLNYFSFALSASIKTFIIKEKFDVVLVNQLSPVMMAFPAIVYKKRMHVKILLYCLDLWPDSLIAGGIKESSAIYNLFLKISRYIYRSADRILITSSMFKDYFENNLSMSSANIKHLPQYAEDIYTTNTDIKKDENYHFVFAGNIGEMQSVETIIRAAGELRNEENISFHIVGDGSALENCKKLASNLDLQNVTFYGRRPIDEMPRFYTLADAMLVTLKDNITLSYTLPGKVQSYMAAGKPILASINGETRRVIEEAGCGLCCNAEDHLKLAEMIMKFSKYDSKVEMGQRSKDYYFENYSKEKFISKLECELKSLEA